MILEKVSITQIKKNPKNPRIIRDDKFKKLVKSIKDFPQMLEIRPIVIDEEGFILGGNMRFKACLEAGLSEVTIIRAENLTEEQKLEFVIKDNANFGEWDWEVLQSNWDMSNVGEWGVDVFELPTDIDYSILNETEGGGSAGQKELDQKKDAASRSILLPFRDHLKMAEFGKLIKEIMVLDQCPGATALVALKNLNSK